MKIMVASCSVVYTGRGDTKLPQGVRAIIVKDDGSVSVHNDKSNKPLNYMGKDNVLTETFEGSLRVWTFDTRKESLRVELHDVISETGFILDIDDAGLIRDGTENQLQAWIADNPEVLGKDFSFLNREFPTGAGPVDILTLDPDGCYVVVEVKRVATTPAVYQTIRYVEALREREGFENVYGIIAAVDLRPSLIALAEKKKIRCVVVPPDWNDNTPDNVNDAE